MERWVLLRKGADYSAIGEKFHISPRMACLIRNRDIIGDEAVDAYLNGTIADLYDGMLMKDMDRAIDILMEKIREGARIRVIGDYDIDGVCATYILLEGLEGLGADVDMDIPDRITDGYGLNRNLLDRAFRDGIDTVITCDNGIAAAEEIDYAKRLGMTVVVTDHHEVPYTESGEERRYQLPPAEAVVDPKRVDCDYPFQGLCGAAVAYKLIECLHEAMGEDASDMDYLLEAVGIATVGDVMDLVGENRIFVKQALEMLGHSSNLGLRSLIECNGIDANRITAYHLGFVIGPCINAGGRLDTAKRALELLRARTKREADILAGDLKALNDSRKELTETAVKEAVRQVENTAIGRDRVLVIYLKDCHESLAGIVAGKIRERYYRPVFVLTDGETDIKGSGRSIEGYHMYEELNKCKDLLLKFGGHKQAAGLSLRRDRVDEFCRTINRNCELTETDLQEKVSIDMQLPFSCITEGFVKELSLLEPFGKGNTKPVFAERNVEFLSAGIIGKNRNMLKLRVRDGAGTSMEALYFGDAKRFIDVVAARYGKTQADRLFEGKALGVRMSITFYPGVNEYRGNRTLQIVITHYQ
ncbi:MAG: single-stranded-DNA-specific exonuclease RecJ [Eubacteriales bacterium]|nr:single-stranded-DNA-specific exonuclease RecJ [Eubacteriales bacterium]